MIKIQGDKYVGGGTGRPEALGLLTMVMSQGSTDGAPLGHGSGVERRHLRCIWKGGLGDYLAVRMREEEEA